jgi:integrase/recombinase XerD
MDIQKAKTARPSESLPELDEFREKLIEQYRKYLFSKRYAESTIKTYSEALRIFFRYFHDKPIDEIDNADLIQFNNEYILKNAYSQAYQNQVVNAVKLFYRKIQHRKLDPDVIERPRTEKKLPNVLSKEEVKMILDALDNVKHKTMLILIYACGLRRSELLNLKLLDIHSTRNQLVVRMSKGKKDRIIPISNVLITLLRSYYAQYKPEIYLFEGQKVND